MTSNQMLVLFLNLVDKNTSNSFQGLSERQMSQLLTSAQLEWVKTRYNNLGNKYQQGFDSTEMRRKGLGELINTQKLLPSDYYIVKSFEISGVSHSIVSGNNVIGALASNIISQISIGQKIQFWLEGHPSTKYVETVIGITSSPNNIILTNNNHLSSGLGATTDFNIIIYQNTSTLAMNGEPNGSLWYLPKDCLWLLTERVQWTTSDCWNGRFAYVKPKAYDDYNFEIDNRFKKPSKDVVWRLDYSRDKNLNIQEPQGSPDYPSEQDDVYGPQPNNSADYKRHILVTDGTPIGAYFITYLRRPRGIWCDTEEDSNQVNCELDEAYHGEIVNEAVKMVLARVGDPRYGVENKETSEEE